MGKIPDVQAGFRKGRGTRDQIANIRWIIKKAREFQKNIYFPILCLATLLQSLLIFKKKRRIFLYGLFVNWASCAKAPQGDDFVNESESESHSVVSDSLQPHGIVHGILQARILEWGAIPFSRGSAQPSKIEN